MARPSANGVLIAGPAGVGKTRLVAEAVRHADEAGLTVSRVTATRSAAFIPLGAVAPLLPPQEPGTVLPSRDSSELLRWYAATLVKQAAPQRLLLVVDDAHLLDTTSAVLVHQLARRPGTFVLATLRTGESTPDAITDLWKDGVLERLDLAALSAESIHWLIGAVLGGPVDTATAVQITTRCQGNALYLREIIIGGLARNTLRSPSGMWRLDGSLPVSERLAELVQSRLANLTGHARELLELVAFGEPLSSAEIATFGDVAAVEELELNALLAVEGSGASRQIRLAHPIYGDVLRARLPELRAAGIARRLAEAVERLEPQRDEDILRIARWRLLCGGGDPGLLLTAATTARWRYDFAFAEALVRGSLDERESFAGRLLLAQVLSLRGEHDAATKEFNALVQIAADDTESVSLATSMIESCFWAGELEEGMEIAKEVLTRISDPGLHAELRAAQAWMLVLTRNYRAAAEASASELRDGTQRTRLWALLTNAYCMIKLGHIAQGLEAIDTFRKEGETLDSPVEWYAWFDALLSSEARLATGELARAHDVADREYRQLLSDGSQEGQAFLAWELGRISLARGQVETASRFTREAAGVFRDLGRPWLAADALITLALALAMQGEPHQARGVLDAIGGLELRSSTPDSAGILNVRAWVIAAEGDIGQAQEFAERAAVEARDRDDPIASLDFLHGLARLGNPERAAQLADALPEHIQTTVTCLQMTHVNALATGNADQLEQVSTEFERLGASLLAAEAAADAATVWTQQAQSRRAAAAHTRASALQRSCEGAKTLALHGVTARARLTPGEQKAASLAARGSSNKQIAAMLGLSVRTIENRLQRTYDKLGVPGRDSLQAVLDDLASTES